MFQSLTKKDTSEEFSATLSESTETDKAVIEVCSVAAV